MNSTMLAPCSMILQPLTTPHRPPAGDQPCPSCRRSLIPSLTPACTTSGVTRAVFQWEQRAKWLNTTRNPPTSTIHEDSWLWMSTNCVWISICLFFTNSVWNGRGAYGSAVSKTLQGTPPQSPKWVSLGGKGSISNRCHQLFPMVNYYG